MTKPHVLVLFLAASTALAVGCREKPMAEPVVRYHPTDEDRTRITVEAEDFSGELERPMTLREDP
ncbi:MAG TPA: hypothetical protein VMZ92_20815, partial [Planctomycetota bacterium]|nr:hypothetical protein [Planctomycetota bacterium]